MSYDSQHIHAERSNKMGDPFVQALAEYKSAYDNWKRAGKRGREPVPAKFGVNRYEAQQIREGMMPKAVFDAMHFEIKSRRDAHKKVRGPAEDPRKVKKHPTRKKGSSNR